MNKDLTKVARIVSSVSTLQVVKMAYFVFLNDYDLMDSDGDEMAFEKAMEESMAKIQEVDDITEKAQESVTILINRVDKQWEIKTDKYGSFSRYLSSLGVDVKQVSIDEQRAISEQVIGKPMTVKEMMNIVG